MSTRTENKIAAAKRVAKTLRKAEFPMQAEAIEALCRANAQLSATCSRLHGDNMKLRVDAQQREAEDMALATRAYRAGHRDAQEGVRKCDPRVILTSARLEGPKGGSDD